MNNAFIIHGSYGSPDGNWFPWLKNALEKKQYEVYVPLFPTPEGQSLDSWLKAFEKYRDKINEDTIFIAHSVGPSFVLEILENLDHSVKACFFVSPFLELLNDPDFDEIIKTLVDREFDWDKIKENCKSFFVYHSDNDPYANLGIAKRVAEKIGVDITLIKGGGHLNAESGYTEFDLLLEDILKED